MRDLTLIDRDKQIIAMVREGRYSYQQIGDNFGISKQRIGQIASLHQEEISDDSYRDLQRTKLEAIEEELFRIFRGPGRQVVTPRGPAYEMLADENGPVFVNGKPVQDLTRPIYDPYAKVDVAGMLIKVNERIAKSYGLDRGRQKQLDQSEEYTAFLAEVDHMVKENAELKAQVAQLSRHQITAPTPQDRE